MIITIPTRLNRYLGLNRSVSSSGNLTLFGRPEYGKTCMWIAASKRPTKIARNFGVASGTVFIAKCLHNDTGVVTKRKRCGQTKNHKHQGPAGCCQAANR